MLLECIRNDTGAISVYPFCTAIVAEEACLIEVILLIYVNAY